MPGGGGGAGNGQAHRGRLEVSDDDSEYNSSMDRRGADRLVKPSQIKKNRSQGWVGDEPGSPCSPSPGGGTQFNKAGSTGSGGRGHFGGDPVPPPVKPRPQPKPGKLNMNNFGNIANAMASMQVNEEAAYAVPKDTVGKGNEYAQPVLDKPPGGGKSKLRKQREQQLAMQKGVDSDSESTNSSDEPLNSSSAASSATPGGGGGGKRAPPSHHHRKKQHPPPLPGQPRPSGAVPVATPKVPELIPRVPQLQSSEKSSPQDSEKVGVDLSNAPDPEKTDRESTKQHKKFGKELAKVQKDKEKKKAEEEKQNQKDEKRRLKEEKKRRQGEEKEAKKQDKLLRIKANSVQSQPSMDDFRTSSDNPIPVFLEKAINFIEKEGLDAEGLYRVPGNRAHVDLLFQKFDEDRNVDIDSLDIAVNAVATAMKDFVYNRLPEILPPEQMEDLEELAMQDDRSLKLLELRKLLNRLPKTNLAVLEFIFHHFVRVAERSKDNCMDSKNLAICWWPTLLRYEFGDLCKFEAMRPHLEEIVQTMIDQFSFLFCDGEAVTRV